MNSPDREFEGLEFEADDLDLAASELDDLELDDLETDMRALLAEGLPIAEGALQDARNALRAVTPPCTLLSLAHDVTESGPRDVEVRSLLYRGHGIAVDVTVTSTGDRCDLVGRIRPDRPCTAAVVTTDVRVDLPDRGDSSFHGRRIPRRPSTLVIEIRGDTDVRRYRTAWTAL